MSVVRQTVWSRVEPEAASEGAHGRTSVQLLAMLKEVQAAALSQGPSAHSHGRATLLVSRVQKDLCRQTQYDGAYAHSLGREAVCLQAVW